jgi:hypothetical protein
MLEVPLREDNTLPVVPADFKGLSYELAQLTDPNFWRRDDCWREVDSAGRRSGSGGDGAVARADNEWVRPLRELG